MILSGLGFILLFMAFALCLVACAGAGLAAWWLRRGGDVIAAHRAARWRSALGLAAAALLLAAGAVFMGLTR